MCPVEQGDRVVTLGAWPLPSEVRELGFDHPRQALALHEHWHVGEFEFVIVERGHAAWEIGNDRFYTRAGEVFHTRPDELHRGRYEIIEPCRFWWIRIVAPRPEECTDGMTSWMGLAPSEAAALASDLWNLPRVRFVGPALVLSLQRLRASAMRTDSLATIECRAAVLDFLLGLVHPPCARQAPHDLAQVMESLLRKLADAPAWRPQVSELAAELHVSVSHFHRLFRNSTGCSPKEYMERARIEEACLRLASTDASVTSIAYDLGYVTSQHFATSFRRVTGQPPTRWRERMRGSRP